MHSRVIYGPFSVEDATTAQLSFELWLQVEQGYNWVALGASVDVV